MGYVPSEHEYDADDAARHDVTGRNNDGVRPPSTWALLRIGLLAFVGFSIFVSLGTWQVQRRAWKLNLIDRVEHRIHAAPVAPPAPSEFIAADDEYRKIRVGGVFSHGQNTLVQAVTELGPGYWVLTPLQTDSGFTLLVNRGFVPSAQWAQIDSAAASNDHVTVTGLVRLTEPGGGFLRANDPGGGHWYSRDVQAIATAHGISDAAPYFVDADDTANPEGGPVGGLTVIAFPNNHLVYAITWYALALMSVGAAIVMIRDQRRSK